MRALHIVQGDAAGDKAELQRRAGDGRTMPSWIVPKAATVGDDVVGYVGGHGFYATARIGSEPTKRPDWEHRYGARLERIRLITPAISLPAIRRHLPGLSWARYPRSITTPSVGAAAQVRRVVAQRRRTKLSRRSILCHSGSRVWMN